MENNKILSYRILISEKDDLLVAFCKELNLTVTGNTVDDAISQITDLIIKHIKNKSPDPVFRITAAEFWQKFCMN